MNISHEGGVLKASFQGDAPKYSRYHIMREFSRLTPQMMRFSRPKSKRCSFKMSKSNLESHFFRDLGKSMNQAKEFPGQKAEKMKAKEEKETT